MNNITETSVHLLSAHKGLATMMMMMMMMMMRMMMVGYIEGKNPKNIYNNK